VLQQLRGAKQQQQQQQQQLSMMVEMIMSALVRLW
jgi:hypothetical protein